jgi:hypothetical protein
MRGTKETLGGMKEGTKSKGRTVGSATTGKGIKSAGKMSGHLESGHGTVSGSSKATVRKGGSSK